ncbi:MAG TPA: ABC transporter substrate-binding protein [Selenomonadales bacterium]|nr:ABC transporter substrate-binding protein [Selenomonadales bacterium]
MSKKLLFAAAVILSLALVLSGCGGGQQADNKGPIKIGFFAPVTGPAAADGKSVLNAAKLAVEQKNKAGGINGRQIELVYYDDQFDTKQAVSIAQKLTTKDGVVAVVSGSYSGPTRAVAKIYHDAKIPMISAYANHPDITKIGNYIFRQSFVGTVQGKAGAKVAVDLLKAKKISILAVDNDFGKGLGDSFKQKAEEMGAQIVSYDTLAMGEKEFTPVLTKIKGLNPDLIYIPVYAGEGSQIVRQAKDLGLTIQMLGTEGIDSTEQFLGVAKDAANGVIITTNLNRDSDRPSVKEFIEGYDKAYGHKPDMVAASTYDAFNVLFTVMAKNGAEPDKIRQGIADLKDFEAVTGLIKGYNEIGEVKKSVQIQIVKDADFHYFAEIKDDDVITPPNQ